MESVNADENQIQQALLKLIDHAENAQMLLMLLVLLLITFKQAEKTSMNAFAILISTGIQIRKNALLVRVDALVIQKV